MHRDLNSRARPVELLMFDGNCSFLISVDLVVVGYEVRSCVAHEMFFGEDQGGRPAHQHPATDVYKETLSTSEEILDRY
jgi:hypothetical protein